GLSDPTQTLNEARAFTPAYAAPEQFRGAAVGVYTDVYALGVLLYELLSRRRPFEAEDASVETLRRMVCEQQPVAASVAAAQSGVVAQLGALGRHEWADLDRLIEKAMEKDPAERYASVGDLIRDLDHFARAEPLEARPALWSYRARKFVQRNRARLAY